MLIKNIEALKTWLTARLEKICDADPAALAKYVVALVRKDKPLGELEEICIDQLEVFLGGETVSFVKTLFEVLQDNSYIPAPPKPTITLPVEPPKLSNPPKQISPPKPANPPKASTSPQQANPPLSPRPASKRLLSTDESLRPQAAESSVLDEDDRDFKRTRKPVEETEEKPIVTINRDYHSSHKAKKRRIESDHASATRIKLSKDNTAEDVKCEVKGRLREEESSRKKDEDSSRKEEDISKKDENSDEHEHELESERSEKKRESSSDHENSQRLSENSKGKHSRSDDSRSVKSRLYKGRPWSKRGRCRDYDEKGYCIRGELCPYDHGMDPLVVEDVNIPGIVLGFPRGRFIPEVATLNPAGLGIRPPLPPIQYPVRPSGHLTANVHVPTSKLPDAAGHASRTTSEERRSTIVSPPIANVRPHIGMTRFKEVIPNMNDMYNPEQPSFDGQPDKPPVWARLGTQTTHQAKMPVQRNRELLQVVGAQTQRPPDVPTPGNQESANKGVVTTSAGIVATPQVVKTPGQEQSNVRTLTTTAPVKKYTNTVLEVKKLPPNLNNIATLNGYFQRFGKIVNIQVSAFGQPDIALIQFSTNFEAHKAISCADAILGNRFIRVFWYKPESEQQKNQANPAENTQPVVAKPTVEKPVPMAPVMYKSGQTTFKASVAVTVPPKRDANTRHVEEVVKKKILLQKQKQDLLSKQIEQQKLLIKKLEQSKNRSQKDKDEVMKTLKSVSESVSKLQSEVKVSAALVRSKESPARARQVAQKELLDRELDLITHEHTGEDTTELRYRVEELKKEAQSLGLLEAGNRGHVRGRSRGIPRGFSRGHGRGRGLVSRSAAVLDKRPKQLLVGGFTAEEKDIVKQRFKEFGGIVDPVEEEKDPHRLIITFNARKQAESAITHVPSLNIQNLKVSWYRPTSTSTLPAVSLKIPIGGSQDQDDSGNAMDEDVEELLLEGDLDEEDEEEERSWRR